MLHGLKPDTMTCPSGMRMRATSRKTWCGLSLNSSTCGSKTRSALLLEDRQRVMIGLHARALLPRRLLRGTEQPAMQRHPIGAQKILPAQSELKSVEAEDVGDFLVEVVLLKCKQVSAERRLEPALQIRIRGVTGHGWRKTSSFVQALERKLRRGRLTGRIMEERNRFVRHALDDAGRSERAHLCFMAGVSSAKAHAQEPVRTHTVT